MNRGIIGLGVAGFLSIAAVARAESVAATIRLVSKEGIGKEVGIVTFKDSTAGLVISPRLTGLTPGGHGIHIHEKPSCEPALKDGAMSAAEAAGPHFDPDRAGHHGGPLGSGHKGDLPVLEVDAGGNATKAVTAPHLTVAMVGGRSFMVHEGGDNYSDQPKPLGGGGARVACGVIGR